jgi:ankyrin repeat protein
MKHNNQNTWSAGQDNQSMEVEPRTRTNEHGNVVFYGGPNDGEPVTATTATTTATAQPQQMPDQVALPQQRENNQANFQMDVEHEVIDLESSDEDGQGTSQQEEVYSLISDNEATPMEEDQDQAQNNANQQLIQAATNGSVEQAQAALVNGQVVNLISDDEAIIPMEEDQAQNNANQQLIQAATNGSVEQVQTALIKDADTTFTDQDGNAALYFAVKGGHVSIVKIGNKALYYAVKGGHLSIVKIMLSAIKQRMANIQGEFDICVLNANQGVEEMEGLKRLAESLVRNINSFIDKGNNKKIILHHAAKEGDAEMVTELLDVFKYVQKIKQKYRKIVKTIKNEESKKNLLNILKKVITTNINYKDSAGNTPLHIAVIAGHEKVVKVIIEGLGNRKSFKYKKNNKGDNPFHTAVRLNNPLVLKVLLEVLENRAKLNIIGRHGYTPLIQAAKQKNPLVLKLLLESGADVNFRDSKSRTALMIAVKGKNLSAVQLLLEFDADINSKNHKKQTVLDIAIKLKFVEIINEIHKVIDATTTTAQRVGETTRDVTNVPITQIGPNIISSRVNQDQTIAQQRDPFFGDSYLLADQDQTIAEQRDQFFGDSYLQKSRNNMAFKETGGFPTGLSQGSREQQQETSDSEQVKVQLSSTELKLREFNSVIKLYKESGKISEKNTDIIYQFLKAKVQKKDSFNETLNKYKMVQLGFKQLKLLKTIFKKIKLELKELQEMVNSLYLGSQKKPSAASTETEIDTSIAAAISGSKSRKKPKSNKKDREDKKTKKNKKRKLSSKKESLEKKKKKLNSNQLKAIQKFDLKDNSASNNLDKDITNLLAMMDVENDGPNITEIENKGKFTITSSTAEPNSLQPRINKYGTTSLVKNSRISKFRKNFKLNSIRKTVTPISLTEEVKEKIVEKIDGFKIVSSETNSRISMLAAGKEGRIIGRSERGPLVYMRGEGITDYPEDVEKVKTKTPRAWVNRIETTTIPVGSMVEKMASRQTNTLDEILPKKKVKSKQHGVISGGPSSTSPKRSSSSNGKSIEL